MPAAVICTSGTAVANLMPAVVEASVDCVPMILLTADRPPELRQTGANQTIDQVKIFDNFVNWQMDIPCPDDNIPPEFVLTTVDQALYRALRSPAGPVHLNFMFREPLAPENKKQSYSVYLRNLPDWFKSTRPFTAYASASPSVSEKSLKNISSVINKSKSGIIVCGKVRSSEAAIVLELAEKIGWPVMPDIASGLRLGVKSKSVIPYFDQILLTENVAKLKPDTVIHFGTQVVSKRLLQFLGQARPENHIRVVDNPQRLDPNHQVTMRVEAEISSFCGGLMELVSKKSKNALSNKFSVLSTIVEKVMSEFTGTAKNRQSILSEPAVAGIISQNISKSGALFLASSLPVREMDMFASANGNSVPVEYNRGASGIDGTIDSTVGYANGLNRTVTLLIGDLAFLHDLNSLAVVKNSKIPIIIVVLNNDGGGIFSFLPVAQIGQAYETFFGTPHGLTFQKSAEQFDLAYHQPKSIGEFTKIYLNSQKMNRSGIIEIKTERKANWGLHQKINKAVKAALDKV
jgi:2-succinyl-5-enolpyruvyl-6-hydroxy-3-cyclohexene-1-carboxylate synthase